MRYRIYFQRLSTVFLFLACFEIAAGCNGESTDGNVPPAGGPLRQKADAFDTWHKLWHQPDYGGTVEVRFTDGTRTQAESLGGWGDSTMWTGNYLASQAFRYHVTGDPAARANAVRIAGTLAGHLYVTETRGYIARYWGPQTSIIYKGDDWCDAEERCFHIESGPFAGDFWWGSTSRDQYIGWFFGMLMAYDLVDDAAVRAQIRAAVLEVLHTLIDNNWIIMAQDGKPTGTAPVVLATTQLAFSTIGYRITGDSRIEGEMNRLLENGNRRSLEIAEINFMNRYTQYYGNNLGHTNWYNILRLGKSYFDEDDYSFLLNLFNSTQHSFTRLSHNAWFNSVYMSQGGWVPQDVADPYHGQLLQDLTDFRDAPNDRYYLPARDPATYTLDPDSVFFHDLFELFPFLKELLGNVNVQAEEAFPVPLQCTTDFLWQRNPFKIDACGEDDPRHVNPGVDYLIAYWVARYHGFLGNEL